MRARDPLSDPVLMRRLYAYVAFRLGDGPDAEDVVSDTLERGLRYRKSYDARKGELIAWLIGIARNCIAELHSRPAAVPLLTSDTGATSADLEQEIVERLALAAAVARLEERDRELVALHYGADLTPREIARLLDAKPNAVEVALHRARSRLRSLLEREPGWDGEEAEAEAEGERVSD